MSEVNEGPTLDEAREVYAAYLSGLPLAKHAAAILDFIGERGAEPFMIREAIDATGGADTGEVFATLSHLSSSRNPALDRSVVFVADDGATHTVEGNLQRYLDGEPYTNPKTGETVADATSHMHFLFKPRPGLFRDIAAGPKP